MKKNNKRNKKKQKISKKKKNLKRKKKMEKKIKKIEKINEWKRKLKRKMNNLTICLCKQIAGPHVVALWPMA